ncbi:MAG: PEGA domain-containing protein [Acidobacteriota bacterium]
MSGQMQHPQKRLPGWAFGLLAGGFGLLLTLASALPADAQAGRTRPGGSSGGGSVSGSSGGSSGGSSASSGPISVPRARSTRPSGGSRGPNIDRRRPSNRRPHYYRGHDHYYYGGYYYPRYYWSPYRHGWWFGYSSWYPWRYSHLPAAVSVYPGPVGDQMGALDTDVAPGRTQVFVNGQQIGTVDDFDGFPRYLWLEKGTYDVVFYLDGYKTLARQYTIYPGVVIDVEDRLERGESVRPEDLPSKSTAVRDARLREAGEKQAAEADWRRRVRAERRARGDRPAGERPAYEAPEGRGERLRPEGSVDARAEPATIRMEIEPADAAVYLNGEFVGSGKDIGDSLIVDAGRHRLTIVRPGYADRVVEVEVGAGDETEVDVVLLKEE